MRSGCRICFLVVDFLSIKPAYPVRIVKLKFPGNARDTVISGQLAIQNTVRMWSYRPKDAEHYQEFCDTTVEF